MSEPVWLDEVIVRILHSEQFQQFGGLPGIRDEMLLGSALARPKNRWAYSAPKPDAVALAASYAFGLAKNHPFCDGNKRVSLIASQLFFTNERFEDCGHSTSIGGNRSQSGCRDCRRE